MLSPENIKRQEFKNSFKGFDKEEVHAFLEKLADEINELLSEKESLKKEFEIVNDQLAEFRKLEKNIQDTLSKAQETSSRNLESTKKQTSLMIQEAELKAQQIIDKAKENANEVRNSLIQLREEKNLLISKLKAIINSQAHLLEMKVESSVKEDHPIKIIEKNNSIDINADDIAEGL